MNIHMFMYADVYSMLL